MSFRNRKSARIHILYNGLHHMKQAPLVLIYAILTIVSYLPCSLYSSDISFLRV